MSEHSIGSHEWVVENLQALMINNNLQGNINHRIRTRLENFDERLLNMAATVAQLQSAIATLQSNLLGLQAQVTANKPVDLQPPLDAVNTANTAVTEMRAALPPVPDAPPPA